MVYVKPSDIMNFSSCKTSYFCKFLTFTEKITYCIHIYTDFIYNHIFTFTITFTNINSHKYSHSKTSPHNHKHIVPNSCNKSFTSTYSSKLKTEIVRHIVFDMNSDIVSNQTHLMNCHSYSSP